MGYDILPNSVDCSPWCILESVTCFGLFGLEEFDSMLLLDELDIFFLTLSYHILEQKYFIINIIYILIL